jgi:hypothetical protein
MTHSCYVLAVLWVLLLDACAFAPAGERNAEEARIEAVTSRTAGLEPQPSTARPLPNRPIELGEGTCAPRLGDKIVGTCIANRACRGYGERDENGELRCACFGLRGGCATSERCDLVKKTCVPVEEPAFGRLPAP